MEFSDETPGPARSALGRKSRLPPNSRLLLVYGHEPSGHSAAAQALEAAARADGWIVERVSVAADHHEIIGRAVAHGYHRLLRAVPGLWDRVYRSESAHRLLRVVRAAYLTLGGARLRDRVRRSGVDAIICPQAAVAAVLAAARRRGELEVPVVSVLTDYGAHPFWADPPADLILAPTDEAAARLRALGAPCERVRVTGLPVHESFRGGLAPESPRGDSAREMLGLPPTAPVVILSGGSKGWGALDRAAAALLREHPRAFALVLCGNNDSLRRSLSRRCVDRLRVFGPQPPAFIAAAMRACDLHVGKPGGMSVAESLASGLPMVLMGPMPGQEDDNARYLMRIGASVFGGEPEAAARVAARLLSDRAALSGMRERALRAARPTAAVEAVVAIRDMIDRNPRVEQLAVFSAPTVGL